MNSQEYRDRIVKAAKMLVDLDTTDLHPNKEHPDNATSSEGKKCPPERWRATSCWRWAWSVHVYARLHPNCGAVNTEAGCLLDAWGEAPPAVRKMTRVFLGDPDENLPKKGKHATRVGGAPRLGELPASRYSEIRPGDWLHIYNGNEFDSNGGHSVVVLAYDASTKIAKVASQRSRQVGGQYDDYDLNVDPVYAIWRSA